MKRIVELNKFAVCVWTPRPVKYNLLYAKQATSVFKYLCVNHIGEASVPTITATRIQFCKSASFLQPGF